MLNNWEIIRDEGLYEVIKGFPSSEKMSKADGTEFVTEFGALTEHSREIDEANLGHKSNNDR